MKTGTLNPSQTEIYYVNNWYEIWDDQDGDNYIIFYDQENNPHVIYLEDIS
jgi:hypothetical protein